MPRNGTRPVVTFLVRTSRDACGGLTGIVECVKTGEKERFTGIEALGRLMERMTSATGGTAKP